MRIRCFACLAVFLMILVSCRQDVNRLSLAGEWNFALDPQDVGLQEKWQEKILDETVQLPGSLQEQGKGEDVSVTTQWTGQIVDSAWYYAPEYEPYRQDGQVKVLQQVLLPPHPSLHKYGSSSSSSSSFNSL